MPLFRFALLFLTTLFWGVTFTVVKEAVGVMDVYVFLAQRFALATVILLGVAFAMRGRLNGKTLRHGTILGALLFAAFAFQTESLRLTTASNAGFLTGLNVVLTPLLGALFLRHVVPGNVRVGVILAVVGLWLLCTGGSWSFNLGDLLASLCAIFVAIHTLFTGRFSCEKENDLYWLTAVMAGAVGLFSGATALIFSRPLLTVVPAAVPAILVCALLATVFAFLSQTYVQRHISPARTALIFCLEPVFAAGYAAWALGERLGVAGYIGGALILAGMLISESGVLSGKEKRGS